MELGKFVENWKERVPVYGLAIFMLIAGLSKFVALDLWIGYEPRFLVELLPLTARQLTLAGGGFEAVLGLALLTGRKTFYTASLTAIYLFSITVQLINLGLYDLAIRDFGLTLYAMSVAILNLENW
jgi:hypothetical protein